jgi:hypothetical protein
MRPKRGRWFGQRGAIQVAAVVVATGVAGVGFGVQRLAFSDDASGSGRVAVPVFGCPGEGAVTDVHAGDRVFAVGVHDELDGWLLIRNPVAPGERWWVEARYIDADGATGDLPAFDCATTPVPADAPDVPGEVLPFPGVGAPTTQPGSPGGGGGGGGGGGSPGGGGGPAPDTTGPSLNVSRNPTEIWETTVFVSCTGRPKQATIFASFSDPSGIASVRATWSVGNVNEDKDLAGGSTTFGPIPDSAIPDGGPPVVVTITVRAVDNAGNATVRTTTISVQPWTECFG